jgi:hypothetical protein
MPSAAGPTGGGTHRNLLQSGQVHGRKWLLYLRELTVDIFHCGPHQPAARMAAAAMKKIAIAAVMSHSGFWSS